MATNEGITYLSSGGVALSGSDAVAMFAAFALASGMNLYLKTGMLPNRAYTAKNMLAAATRYTGKTYKRSEMAQAAADVKLWAQTMKAALPVQGE